MRRARWGLLALFFSIGTPSLAFGDEPAPAGATPAAPASPATDPSATPAPEAATEAATTPAAPAIDEVKVSGKRRELGQRTLTAREIRETPGAFGDPFRAVEALPGVTPLLSGLSYFFIRGAPPNNNGYYLDGIRVPQLYHLALGPGVIHPGLVDRIEFYPGAAPASYGRTAGAVIAGQTRDPASRFHGEANLRLVDAGALVETPFADGRGTALAAARYGYPGPVVGLFSDVQLGYWDYQTRATWRLGERDVVGLFAFGSHDYLAHKEQRTGKTVEDVVSDFHRIDLRWDRTIEGGRIRTAATLGFDSMGSSTDGPDDGLTKLTNRSIALRTELDKRLSGDVRARAGGDIRIDDYGFSQPPPNTNPNRVVTRIPSNADPPPRNVTGGVHADLVWRVAPRVEIVPGARVDVYSSTRAVAVGSTNDVTVTRPAVEPRMATRVALVPGRLTWLSTFGLAHQYPALRVGSVPGIFMTGSGFPPDIRKLQLAAQSSQGAEVVLPADLTFTATGFLSSFTGLTDLTAECVEIEPAEFAPPQPGVRPTPRPVVCPGNQPVHGRAYGVELQLRRPLTKRLSGMIAYTLSRAEREAHFFTEDAADRVANVPSEYDRTHVLNAILGYDLGRRWRAGGRFVFYTGVPYSTLAGNVPLPPYRNQRTPSFVRVDVRLEKRWPLGRDGSIAFVVEGQNITLSKEFTNLGMDCEGNVTEGGGTTQCTQPEIGPITIPSIGVEAFF